MDLELTPREQEFRREVGAWLEENKDERFSVSTIKTLPDDEGYQRRRAWTRKLGEGAWLGLAWPKEYGGRGATLMEKVVYHQELARHGMPEAFDTYGPNIIGPTIIEVGTEAQKAKYLPEIISGEVGWCQGFSEPNAGSDLAGLQTRADLDGDEWVINGQKIWSSGAHHSERCFLLARTDQQAPKHKGISFLLLEDMKTPGLTIRPIKQITGDAHFNEMFFEDVRIPRENILGGVNEGWFVANRLLTFERGVSTMALIDGFEEFWRRLRAYALKTKRNEVPLAEDPRIRERLAQLWIDIQLMRYSNVRYITWYERGRPSGLESSLVKLQWPIVDQGLGELAVALTGPDGLREGNSERAIDNGEFIFKYLQTRAATIYGGTQDIQRNIIAERMLGMPR